MTILSFDKESFRRGLNVHPLPEETAKEVRIFLDDQLNRLIEQNVDVVLDYSFWSKEIRAEYIALLKKHGITPVIYYIKTPKEIILDRIRNRKGSRPDDIMLPEQVASYYYDHFQPPTADEGTIIIVEGCESRE